MKPEQHAIRRQIRDTVEEEIRLGILHPGDRLPSIRAFRERFPATQRDVLEALQQLIDSGLIISRAKSGFYVAAKNSDGDACIAVIRCGVSNYTWAEIVHSLQHGLDDTGFALRFISCGPDEKPSLPEHYAAAIVLSGLPLSDTWETELRQGGKPFLVAPLEDHCSYPSIAFDSVHAAQILVTHLINEGKQRIAFLSSTTLLIDPSFRARQAGFHAAMLATAREVRMLMSDELPWSAPTSRELLQQYIATEKPDALICGNATQARDVLAILGEAAPCIAAMTDDGMQEFTKAWPGRQFPCLSYDCQALGLRCAQRICELIADTNNDTTSERLPCRLRILPEITPESE